MTGRGTATAQLAAAGRELRSAWGSVLSTWWLAPRDPFPAFWAHAGRDDQECLDRE